ncbi:hypothetical protein BV22DRAFT_397845 [Leucogyrophana mollusca]|uniref:Uncharacterized protein n=1 Tax=Leucogyrophana mollusca TaxID=85980 RepID=A0ACB8BM34_9AGAM|nr:hypothetical protein BV22DRAFT_397845 [Leucogyrophana mollusca]
MCSLTWGFSHAWCRYYYLSLYVLRVTFHNGDSDNPLPQNWTQDGQYWLGGPAPIICKSYTNSLLAVLNARKFIRERVTKTVELSTIPPSRTPPLETGPPFLVESP